MGTTGFVALNEKIVDIPGEQILNPQANKQTH